MAKITAETTQQVEDHGIVLDRWSEVDGYTISFTTFRENVDMATILAGLPGGRCACPHWGYVLEGGATVNYADHDETLGAGDAFYMAPGHVPVVDAGTTLVMFSPTDQLAATDAAIREAMQSQPQP